MHPVDFSYTAPTSVAEVCAELSDEPGRACLLAGGMSLMPLLVRRMKRPQRLIDITRIDSLRPVAATGDGLRVGAAVTQRTLERSAELTGYDLLRQALPRIGTVPTRNRGTIGGSLAHADPAAQLGVCLVALGGELVATSNSGSRRIPATDFFRHPYRTALRTDELLTEVLFARPARGTVSYFESVSLRGIGDPPLLSVALLAHPRADAPPRLVVGGAGQSPTRVPVDVTDAVAEFLHFDGNTRAGAAHRRRLAAHTVARLLRRFREEVR